MLDSILQSQLTAGTFLICTAVSLILGIGTAWLAGFRSRTSQSLAVTLAILPAVVQTVILLVNGSIGAGVAVAGAFGLVRFRSAPSRSPFPRIWTTTVCLTTCSPATSAPPGWSR